jgi:outer membrane biosynthesis protein TonB
MKITATVSFAGHEIAMAFGETREVADEMATLLVRDGLAIEVATEDKTPAAPVNPPTTPVAPEPPTPKGKSKAAGTSEKPKEPKAPKEPEKPKDPETPKDPEAPKGPETTDSTEGQNPEQTQQS